MYKKKLLASILIANYNKEKYISRSIASCLKQTYKNIEIIFVDDSSKDNSLKVAKKFKKIRIFKKKRLNSKSNFNTFFQIKTYLHAFKKSQGELIFFLDADDFFKRNKVDKIINIFKKNPNTKVIFDKPIVYYSKKNYSKEYNNYRNRKLPWPQFPPQSCIAVKRSFFEKIISEIDNKNYSLLTLDFRLAAISHFVYNNYQILNNHLTFYFQDPMGESNFKFKKYNFNWWLRRQQAHKYCNYLVKKYDKHYRFSIDSFVTNIIILIFKLFK